MMMSFLRSVILRKPSASISPMSPVWNQPSASMACARGLGVVPVALHDVRSAREDLAVLGDLHLDAGNDRADRADAALVRRVDGDDRRGLGEAVALVDLEPGADEERRQLGARAARRRRGRT